MVDFRLPPDLEGLRKRVAAFVEREVLPMEEAAVRPDGGLDDVVLQMLRKKAHEAGLWTPHLPREWGGLGLNALGMAVVSQELGVSPLAPLALNCMAPDEGNMHTLLLFGSDEQKTRWLKPLAEGRIRSCFAMTEKGAGADPTMLKTRAERKGDGWVLNGEKWFISGAKGAAVAIVVAVTDPARPALEGCSLFLVPCDTPGWRVLREIPVMGTHMPGGHCEVALDNVHLPAAALLGEEGRGFIQAQVRLGLGRIAHAMRWIGVAQRALDMSAERATERVAFGGPLADKQAVQWMLADSATELHVSRLLVLHAAWKIDEGEDPRQEIAMLKVYVANAMHRIIDRAIQIHGALGYSDDLPLARFYRDARAARIYDGPDEVHQMLIARNVLKALKKHGTTKPAAGGWV